MNPLETYLKDLRDIHATGAAVAETSFYPALSNLLNEIGQSLRPKVRCVMNIANRGAGLPDGGLFIADQFQRASDAEPIRGQAPARGALEVKGPAEGVEKIARTEQVERYFGRYGLVLVTNYGDFLLLGCDRQGKPEPRERYTLADDERTLWALAAHPQKAAKEHGERFCEYLKRVLLSNAPLSAPQDVAWFLASYARDAKARVEQHKDLSALDAVRSALEEALGMQFTGERGEHFFRSTLVQTIFYGVFSAWVLWHRERPGRTDAFDWHSAEWFLHVPFIHALYHQITGRDSLGPLGLVEVLDWTAAALNRVAFFDKFQEEQAVQYFYEPFLEAFDPELRKELGVWYTPREIVQYQVARVDAVLREELDLSDGLADPNVVVLDPCCGTAAYLVEVLKKIAETLRAKGGDALLASDLKKAAMTRVFGFEILPAPFVVSHLQLGLMLHRLGVPLSVQKNERVGVYLTNSLTGWEPPREPKRLLFPELEAERDAAERVKQHARILVVLGNPPYNAFAGVSPEEEQGLVEPYKEGLNTPTAQGGWGIKKFNLDDLYVRFFRLAERRIAEMTGRGVVSFISNHSWIAEPSFVVLRKHLLENFDRFWIENLHGNRKISEYAPDGRTSETIFAIRGFSVGIQQGVATSLWVKTGKPRRVAKVLFRDDIDAAKAEERRQQLLATLSKKRFDAAYAQAKPSKENRFSFRPEDVATAYGKWVSILDLSAGMHFNGPYDARNGALYNLDRDDLRRLMQEYYDPSVGDEEVSMRCPDLMAPKTGYQPARVRSYLTKNSKFREAAIYRIQFKPFDRRFYYCELQSSLCCRPSPELMPHVFDGNVFLVSRSHGVAQPEGASIFFASTIVERDQMRGHARLFPILLAANGNSNRSSVKGQNSFLSAAPTPNLSRPALAYLAAMKIKDPDGHPELAGLVWMHALAIGYSPAYLAENADGIRRDWPRIPLPDKRKTLETSAALGRKVAALLDTEAEVSGVTGGRVEALFRTIAVLSSVGGGALDPEAGDLAVTAGWGHAGKGGVTMPAKGRVLERPYEMAEHKAIYEAAKARGLSIDQTLSLLGPTTRDVYLNDRAYWKNIPASVWEYYIGGYEVIKKWLSYREQELLGRPLRPEEARDVTNIARRITAIVLVQPALDANYQAVKASTYPWPGPKEG